ncbi:MAG: immunoglobulin domain-containing protein, partial [Verrucomicrobiota bacterium]
VDTNNMITTVAGNGTAGYSGDGATATNASLSGPSSLAVDAFGNLYIADASNHRIRKVLPPGSPTLALAKVSAVDAGNYTVVVTSPYGSVTSAVAALTVQAPPVITVQPASQIAVAGSSPILSVVVAGSGPFEYLWYFASTNLVQSSTNSSLTVSGVLAKNGGNYTVMVTNPYGSVTSQVATLMVMFPPSVATQPSSQAVSLGTNVALSVTVDGTGPFSYQWRFNGVDLPNNIITTVAGNGTRGYSGDGGAATNAGFDSPHGIALDGFGNQYIADLFNNRIRKVDTNGTITTIAGKSATGFSGDGGLATNASLSGPMGVGSDAVGNLYIADYNNYRIRRVDTNGIITTVAGKSVSGYSGDGGAATNASLRFPCGVALDGYGNVYIADSYNNRIRKMDATGTITTVAGKSASGFSGDGGLATNADLSGPLGMGSDAVGNLYIADYGNNRIRRVDTNGIITTVAGKAAAGYSGDGGAATNASLRNPYGVTLDGFGNLYIADTSNNRIRKVDTNGIITTVAGNGTPTFAGDGGAPTNASVPYPTGVAVDAVGNLYIAEYSDNRIRKVFPPAGPILALANVSASNAGYYTVVVTSPYGSVTSSVAVLTVTVPPTPPQIINGDASIGFRSNLFGFNLSGSVGQTIVVDGSTDLVDWIPLFTNTVSISPFYFSDPASTNFPWRYYRGRLP